MEVILRLFSNINLFAAVVNFSSETFINMARPFMGALLDKFDFYGPQKSHWRARLMRKIPADQLPPKYGGVEGWKPLPLDPSRR